jgi:hypothetical protein
MTGPDGTVREMTTAQTEGSCAHCHREPAAGGTLGRIYLIESDAGLSEAGDGGVRDGSADGGG